MADGAASPPTDNSMILRAWLFFGMLVEVFRAVNIAVDPFVVRRFVAQRFVYWAGAVPAASSVMQYVVVIGGSTQLGGYTIACITPTRVTILYAVHFPIAI